MLEAKRAILLLGPTGSGKTPLGDLIERRGWRGYRCIHFDFGAQLRGIGKGESRPAYLSEEDRQIVIDALARGALLERENFHIAEKILRSFAERNRVGARDCLVLDGLPRHVDQAKALEDLVRVEWILYLSCSPEVALRRIRVNAGGDREGRADDREDLILHRLELFRRRTLPLLSYYQARGVRVEKVEIGEETTPEDIWRSVEDRARL